MMRIEETVFFKSDVTFGGSVNLPSACVGNAQIKTAAGIDAEKLEHQHRKCYAQESDTTAAAESRVVHVVKGTVGVLQAFRAGCVVANVGDSTITVDLLKNGVTLLTAPISLSSADSAYDVVAGTLASAGVVVGDVLEVAIVATVGEGTLGTGVFASLDLHENES